MKVPKTMLEKYNVVAPLITGFCEEYLNEEYASVSLLMLEKLCRKRPSPLLGGKPNTWACGIVYAVGSVNFLFDKSQTPHMRASVLAEKFGLSQSTAGNKAREINKLLNIGVFEPEWTLPSRIGDNPMTWMFESGNGFIFDARYAPREVQEDLFDAGMIPFIPADRKKVEEDPKLAPETNRILSKKEGIPNKKHGLSPIEGQFSIFNDQITPDADDEKLAERPVKPIIHINGAGSFETLGSIEDYCSNNKDFKQMLNKFSDGYIPVYNKRKVALREEIKIYMRRNFNTWYCSGSNPVFQISPARFINSDIYCKFGAGAVVFPVCKPVFNKSRIAEITYAFHVFTLDDHPFIRDMRLFLESTKGIGIESWHGEAYDSVFDYAVSVFAGVTKNAEFTFNERPYIIALGDVCERLALISISSARDGIIYDEDRISAFFSAPGKEKLGQVIDVLIERFVEGIDSLEISGKKPDAEEALNALQEEHSIESFFESLFGDIYNNLVIEIESFLDEGADPIDMLEALDEEKAQSIFEVHSVISMCCSHFFTVFGQYLQMILPENNDPFTFSVSDDDYLDALEFEEENSNDLYYKLRVGATVYYKPPGGYGLTPLGAGWFGIDLPEQDNVLYPLVSPGYYQETLDGMLEDDMDKTIDGYMRKMLGDSGQQENLKAMFESIFGPDIMSAETYQTPDPLEGLNPTGLPVYNDKNAVYKFRVGRCTIRLDGTDTLSDLSRAIQFEYDLNEERMSSFYMGKKFFEQAREIRCPRMDFFSDDGPVESDNYMIWQLNLYMKQKFLYLNDFRSENRFTVTFVGVE